MKRLRIFVSFQNQEVHDTFYPYYGNFIEFRINEKKKQRVVNWAVNPALDDYTRQKCRGVKVKADYDKDLLVYKLPGRCAGYLQNVGYIDSYASARKFKPSHWDDGSPADYDGRLVRHDLRAAHRRVAECPGAESGSGQV